MPACRYSGVWTWKCSPDRSNDQEARQLLRRAYERVGLDVTSTELPELILTLIEQIKIIDPKMISLAERIRLLALETF